MDHPSLSPGLIPIQPSRCVQQLKQEGRPVLLLSLSLPRLVSESRGAEQINRYYQRLADQWRARWCGPLYQRACAAERAALDASRPFRPWRVQVDYTLTLQTPTLLSLFWEVREELDAAGLPRRHGDTWQLPWGAPLSLHALLLPSSRRRSAVLAEVARQIRERTSAGEEQYHQDWPRLIRTRFSPERFYVTEEGPVLFYPACSIAPRFEGTPAFSLSALAGNEGTFLPNAPCNQPEKAI